MIIKGASGKDAEIPISLFDTDGVAITGHTWVTGEVLLALPNGTFANATVANIVEKGRGKYALQLTGVETSTTGAIELILDTTNGYLPHSWQEVIWDPGTVVANAVMAYSFRSGRTVLGFFRRMDGLFFNKVTGLKSALATIYQPGGVLVEATTTQDVTAGNKSESTVTNSETP